MEREVSLRITRVWLTLPAACALLLVHLAPTLGLSPSITAHLMALSVAMIAVAAAALTGPGERAVAAGPGSRWTRPGDTAPVLRGRATDPRHHPLSPRAPALA